ncbi:MAG: pilus assembly protein CpaC [Alphaproteobacteria bacterium HGW-Alphaproteobacteria-12]|nr:MAG: pilus assembly protein CpaC [Alphaproteobacteria bacterium HGW-Alphaproteobacteria-12]
MRAYRTKKTVMRRVIAAALGAGCMALAAGAAQAEAFKVEMNQTKALHLAKPVSTIMVGNPAIADVSVESSKLVYVMGRSFGTTNLVATDSEGNAILDIDVSVIAQGASTVTLTRGTGQLSYNCTPRCERVPAAGDNPDDFDAVMQQVADTIGAATSASQSEGNANAAGGGIQ